jgi:putative transposase
MSQATSPSTDHRYGLARVCRVWQLPRSTVYHQRKQRAIPAAKKPQPRRRGPQGPCSDEELVEQIRRVLRESPFHGEGYRKVWARLRFQEIRTSRERVRRLMREHGLQAPQRVGHPHGRKAHDGTIITPRPDMMWGTDLTITVTTDEGTAHVFVTVDHCTCELVGIHAAKSGNRFEALQPIRQAVRERFGRFDAGVATGLVVRHDHGSQYLADDFQNELSFLGIQSSPSFVREPEGNGCAERFIRTLKENLLWVRHFRTIEELRLALLEFQRQYNHQWLIERHGYRTPADVRQSFTTCLESAA